MATLTLTTTSQQDARIVQAFGTYLDLGRNATAGEVKQWLISQLRGVVLAQEAKAAREAAEAALTDLGDVS